MEMYWPGDTLIVSNVAREVKRVAYPWNRRGAVGRLGLTINTHVKNRRRRIEADILKGYSMIY